MSHELLSIMIDPNIAYLLMILGIWGIFFEFAHPGFILPGLLGTCCLVIALYAFHLLPVSYVGLSLILLGVVFMTAEAFLMSYGILGIGGVIAFIIGSIMLLKPGTTSHIIALPLIIAVSILSAVFFLLVINFALKARRKPVVTGREELIGLTATIISIENNQAWIRIHGELWQVKADTILKPGQRVKIKNLEGVILFVEPVN